MPGAPGPTAAAKESRRRRHKTLVVGWAERGSNGEVLGIDLCIHASCGGFLCKPRAIPERG